MTSVGFTGTQAGMTRGQQSTLRGLLHHMQPTEFHHGDCIGADAQAALIAQQLGIPTICHPPADPKKRAWTEHNARTLPPLPYLVRDHAIVNDTDVLIATPYQTREVLRSGTWATCRYARKQNRVLRLVAPDGRVIRG